MDLYLHHYPASPFSEKIRLILGYLGLPWRSVEIPNVMPRPLLMPLSGGYRRTPCLQIGANVYCDSAAIARGLVRWSGDPTLFAPGFAAQRVAEWADTQLFRVSVALNFRPEAVGPMLSQLSPAEVAAFGADRAELTRGSTLQTFSPVAARAYLAQYLCELDASIGNAFLFGASPSIADFSLYHCLWFLQRNAVNAPLLGPFGSVGSWMARVAAFGHGKPEDASGQDALAHARACEPVVPELASSLRDGVSLGDRVTVTPVDYGKIPVEGRLVARSDDEIVLERQTPETGRVLTHFPSAGFEIAGT
jgi:glutathione S-transferase